MLGGDDETGGKNDSTDDETIQEMDRNPLKASPGCGRNGLQCADGHMIPVRRHGVRSILADYRRFSKLPKKGRIGFSGCGARSLDMRSKSNAVSEADHRFGGEFLREESLENGRR